MKKTPVVLLLLVSLFFGCSTNDNPTTAPERTDDIEKPEAEQPDVLSNDKQLLSFTFSKSSNAIPVDTEGDLGNNTLRIFLPPNTILNGLIPEFTISEKASSFVNDQEVSSGATSLDFSTPITLQIVAENGTSKNYTLTIVTDFTALDARIDALMTSYTIPGLQLAIVKDEELVYSKSFGFADQENRDLVSNSSLFRIASISKPITATAILKLAEMNLLDLDERVFGSNGILGTAYGTAPYTAGIEQITVRHLLEHTAGWTNAPFDPMFTNLGYTQSELITDMLDNRLLATTPGTTYYYSNFGYCVLGRIIEKVSSLPYRSFIEEYLLAPSDISSMEIAGNTLAARYPNEVSYYDQENFSPYAMNVARMDSHGGWIASATDLAKLLTRIDRNLDKPDLVASNYLEELYFGFPNWVFYGSLPGTSSAIARVDDSFGYVILANTRTQPVDEILAEMNTVLQEEISSRSNWPNYDLFEAF